MRAKYVEESFPRYFIHGEYSDGERVDIVSLKVDPICTVTKEEAQRLIRDRDELLDKLISVVLRFSEVNDEEFTRFWYPR